MPYLVGVGLQVSGITNIPLSVGIFEVAAVIAGAVTWSLWAEWRQTAIIAVHLQKTVHRIRRWPGIYIPRIGMLPTEILAAILIFILSNAVIVGFVNLAEHSQQRQQVETAHREQLKKFYAQLGGIFFTQLAKDMSNDDYDKWEKQVIDKEDEILKWVYANMGQAAEYRLADLQNVERRNWPNAINEKHRNTMNYIFHLQKNLRAMIENTTTWDERGEKNQK